jgi:hypothetical protein
MKPPKCLTRQGAELFGDERRRPYINTRELSYFRLQVILFSGRRALRRSSRADILLPEHAMREDGASIDTNNIEAPWKIART